MLDLLPPDQRKGFLRLFGQFVQQRQKPAVEWARLEAPPPEVVVQARDIPPCPKDQALRHELLDKMVILKLNGESDLRLPYEGLFGSWYCMPRLLALVGCCIPAACSEVVLMPCQGEQWFIIVGFFPAVRHGIHSVYLRA